MTEKRCLATNHNKQSSRCVSTNDKKQFFLCNDKDKNEVCVSTNHKLTKATDPHLKIGEMCCDKQQ